MSNVPFTLAWASPTVTAPNGRTWPIAATRTIRWSHNLGIAETVDIEVSRDGGATWEVVASGQANATNTSGTFDWLVSGPATTTARVRVTWSGGMAVTDLSNADFRIRVRLDAPSPTTARPPSLAHSTTDRDGLRSGRAFATAGHLR